MSARDAVSAIWIAAALVLWVALWLLCPRATWRRVTAARREGGAA